MITYIEVSFMRKTCQYQVMSFVTIPITHTTLGCEKQQVRATLKFSNVSLVG